MNLIKSKETGRFLRFAVVGCIGAVIDFGIFNLLTVLKILPSIWAQVISFTTAVISNFYWNRRWTYQDSRSKPMTHQFFQFFVVNVAGLAIRTPLFAYLEKFLISLSGRILPAGTPLTPVFIGHNLSLASVIIIVMIWNFFINRYWTYNDVK
ncbi:MAG: GtrA family protein [Anaerolineaceae bacterium]|jgi:putative flippase GtrA